jgi:hypothetical protein
MASPSPGQEYRPHVPSRLSSHDTPPLSSPPKTTTTYAPPPAIEIPSINFGYEMTSSPVITPDQANQIPPVPPTPAYPAYPPNTAFPSTPNSQVPIAVQQQAGSVGPSVEIRRDRRMGMNGNAGIPQTPGPLLVSGLGDRTGLMGMGMDAGTKADVGEPIVISVGILPIERDTTGGDRIYPLDTFTLDIFVFNQSSWTRRFEVSVPDNRRQRRLEERERQHLPVRQRKKVTSGVGVVSLDNRVRIG